MQIFGVAAIDIAWDQLELGHSLPHPMCLCVCGFNDISVEQLKQQQEQQQSLDELKNAPRIVCGRATQWLRTQTWQPNERLRTQTCKLKHINFAQHKTETPHLQQHAHLHHHQPQRQPSLRLPWLITTARATPGFFCAWEKAS